MRPSFVIICAPLNLCGMAYAVHITVVSKAASFMPVVAAKRPAASANRAISSIDMPCFFQSASAAVWFVHGRFSGFVAAQQRRRPRWDVS